MNEWIKYANSMVFYSTSKSSHRSVTLPIYFFLTKMFCFVNLFKLNVIGHLGVYCHQQLSLRTCNLPQWICWEGSDKNRESIFKWHWPWILPYMTPLGFNNTPQAEVIFLMPIDSFLIQTTHILVPIVGYYWHAMMQSAAVNRGW